MGDTPDDGRKRSNLEDLEAVPGLPGKTARDIWTHLHRTGD